MIGKLLLLLALLGMTLPLMSQEHGPDKEVTTDPVYYQDGTEAELWTDAFITANFGGNRSDYGIGLGATYWLFGPNLGAHFDYQITPEGDVDNSHLFNVGLALLLAHSESFDVYTNLLAGYIVNGLETRTIANPDEVNFESTATLGTRVGIRYRPLRDLDHLAIFTDAGYTWTLDNGGGGWPTGRLGLSLTF